MNNLTIERESALHNSRYAPVSKGNLIVCLDPSLPVAGIKAALRADGWQVFCARKVAEMRALTSEMDTAIVLLSDHLPGNESAYLATGKLLMTSQNLKVVIVGTRPSAKAERLAEFVGAEAYVAIQGPEHLRDRLNELAQSN